MRKYPSATVLIAILVSAGACQTGGSSPSGAEADLNAYVTEYLRDLYRDTWDRRARYSLALADLNGDGAEEALVHVRGGHCGTGGCGVLVFTRTGQSWHLHSDIQSGHAPLRLLSTQSHGWRDIGVLVAGGGAVPHEARLSFDGSAYPDNPYRAPPTAIGGVAAGRVLIRRDEPASPIFTDAVSAAPPVVDCARKDCPPM
jgi:hypothetical protein